MTLLFGWYYIVWWLIKLCAAILVFCIYDWWIAIVQGIFGKSHIWLSSRIIRNSSRYYYCHRCGYNFKG